MLNVNSVSEAPLLLLTKFTKRSVASSVVVSIGFAPGSSNGSQLITGLFEYTYSGMERHSPWNQFRGLMSFSTWKDKSQYFTRGYGNAYTVRLSASSITTRPPTTVASNGIKSAFSTHGRSNGVVSNVAHLSSNSFGLGTGVGLHVTETVSCLDDVWPCASSAVISEVYSPQARNVCSPLATWARPWAGDELSPKLSVQPWKHSDEMSNSNGTAAPSSTLAGAENTLMTGASHVATWFTAVSTDISSFNSSAAFPAAPPLPSLLHSTSVLHVLLV
mmetsp:Transcript_11168/g.30027  ORF Transcript_11168/g.30027 Transcript_11168/m.30027 type:complete len:275 (+) Transcript_11168:244-1068(+)